MDRRSRCSSAKCCKTASTQIGICSILSPNTS